MLLYDTWSVTEASRQRLDAFDQWCLRRILRVPYRLLHTVSVRSQTNQSPVSSLIQQHRLKLFGHMLGLQPLRTTHVRYEHPPIASLLIGAAQEVATSSVLASNNRERSQTAQPWTSLCFTASNRSSFLTTHRGNGYALRACHLMMMI